MLRTKVKHSNPVQIMPFPENALLNSSLNTDELQTFELGRMQSNRTHII
jgi:hypothetical protein